MRFSLATIAFYAAYVLAQSGENAISIPGGQSTLDVTAGQSVTIQWTNPSDGTVTIRLQNAGTDQLADSGIVLASDIPASGGAATFEIPADAVEAGQQYTFRITDDTDPSNVNFAPAFTVSGAEGTAALPTGGASSTVSGASTSGTSTSDDSSSTTTDESSSTTTTDESSTTGSTSTTARRTTTSSSETAAASTEAPNSGNGAGALNVQGGVVAAAAMMAALF